MEIGAKMLQFLSDNFRWVYFLSSHAVTASHISCAVTAPPMAA